MSAHNWANESQDTTAPVKRRLSDASPRRFDPALRADLTEFARQQIEAVWADVGAVPAQVLAENVVSAQEFLWLSLHFPIDPKARDADVRKAALEEAAQIALRGMHIHHGFQSCIKCDTQIAVAAAIRATALGDAPTGGE